MVTGIFSRFFSATDGIWWLQWQEWLPPPPPFLFWDHFFLKPCSIFVRLFVSSCCQEIWNYMNGWLEQFFLNLSLLHSVFVSWGFLPFAKHSTLLLSSLNSVWFILVFFFFFLKLAWYIRELCSLKGLLWVLLLANASIFSSSSFEYWKNTF